MGGDSSRRISTEQLYASVHPDDRTAAHGARDAALAHGGGYEQEFRRISPAGRGRALVPQQRQSGDGRGQAVKVTGAIMDITRQKELMLSLEQAKVMARRARRPRASSWPT
jgi:PAS domain-containing protein